MSRPWYMPDAKRCLHGGIAHVSIAINIRLSIAIWIVQSYLVYSVLTVTVFAPFEWTSHFWWTDGRDHPRPHFSNKTADVVVVWSASISQCSGRLSSWKWSILHISNIRSTSNRSGFRYEQIWKARGFQWLRPCALVYVCACWPDYSSGSFGHGWLLSYSRYIWWQLSLTAVHVLLWEVQE